MTNKERSDGQEDQESTEEALDREIKNAAKAVDDYVHGTDHGIIHAVLTKMLNEAIGRPSLLLTMLRRQESIERKIEALKKISAQPFFMSNKDKEK